jgi:undecaprenyl diphosphate synthase
MEHLAIIMDGNGRWAKARGLPRSEGHRAGGETVRRVLGFCKGAGIRYLTLYAFSVENWKRPKDEVEALMSLLVAYLAGEESMMHEHQVRLRVMAAMPTRPADSPRRDTFTEVSFETKFSAYFLIAFLIGRSR